MPDPATPALRPGEVHVWSVALASTHTAAAGVAGVAGLLSPEERDRAARFRFEQDQARYVSARGALRILLGRYCGIPPGEIGIGCEPQGKPHLASTSEWQFNLSHSRDAALIAICRENAVGIDLERIDPDFPRLDVAPDILASEELNEMRGMPAAEQTAFFFAMWTLKEALLKAAGKGFSLEPRAIRVRLGAGGEPELVSAPPECLGARLFRLAPREGFAAALAVLGGDGGVEMFDFERDSQK